MDRFLNTTVGRYFVAPADLNSLNIRGNPGRVPAAEPLLRNMLDYMARDMGKALANRPADFDAQVDSRGCE
jgi:hypothetical protein